VGTKKLKEISLRNITEASELQQIQQAMCKEMDSFKTHEVSQELSKEVGDSMIKQGLAVWIPGRWVFVKKVKKDEQNQPYTEMKARYVLRGDKDTRQIPTNSPTPSWNSIRSFLTVGLSSPRTVLADIKTAFLNTTPKGEQVRVVTPALDAQGERVGDKVWILNKVVYGLKEAPREWWRELTSRLHDHHFHRLYEEPCIWIKTKVEQIVTMILAYVDDLVGSGQKNVDQQILDLGYEVSKAPTEISGQDLLGITVTQQPVSQSVPITYIELCAAEYVKKKCPVPPSTKKPGRVTHRQPIPESFKVDQESLELSSPFEITTSRKLTGIVSWLAQTVRPDLALAAHVLSTYMARPNQQSLQLAWGVIEYIHHTVHYAIRLTQIQKGDQLVAFCDASHKGKQGLTGYIVGILRKSSDQSQKLNSQQSVQWYEFYPLAWKSSYQSSTTWSSMAGELKAIHTTVSVLRHLYRLLSELGHSLQMELYTASKDTTEQMSSISNPKDLDLIPMLQHTRQLIAKSNIATYFIPRQFMIADELTAPRKVQLLVSLVNPERESKIRLPMDLTPVRLEQFMLVYDPRTQKLSKIRSPALLATNSKTTTRKVKDKLQVDSVQDLWMDRIESQSDLLPRNKVERQKLHLARGRLARSRLTLPCTSPYQIHPIDESKLVTGNKETKVLLELCSGTASASKTASKLGFKTITLDQVASYSPSIVADVVKWSVAKWYRSWLESGNPPVTHIWSSPPCSKFSAMNVQKGRRIPTVSEIEDALQIVARCSDVSQFIRSVNRRLFNSSTKFYIENPATGLLSRLHLLDDLHKTTVDYCKYKFPINKPTCIWSNQMLKLEPQCSEKYPCPKRSQGKSHDSCLSKSSIQLYEVPEELVRQILSQ